MRNAFFINGLLLLLGTPFARAQFAIGPAERAAGHALDHVLVKFKTAEVARVSRNAAQLGLPVGAQLVASAFDAWVVEHEKRTTTGPTFDRFVYCTVPAGRTASDILSELQKNPAVEYAELDPVGTGGFTPNDPIFTSQWHLRNLGTTNAVRPDIRATNTWDLTRGASNVILAVLDTGLNTSVVDFAGRILPGYDFAYGDASPVDDYGHGTAVSAVAAARGNDTSLVAGVDWNCRIMPVKVLDSANSGLYSWWASGIDWARTNGADVINLSAGGSTDSASLGAAITNFINAGRIFVTITHNDSSSTVRFPGRIPLCITVGATQSNDVRSSFSNYGTSTDLVAPGSGIRTLNLDGSVGTWSGTSFAGPQVAGVCCLLRALRPGLTHHQARTLLCAAADDRVGSPTEDTAGFDNYHGWGRLNAWATLQLALATNTTFQLGASGPELEWPSPLNASNRRPQQIQYAASPTGTWTTIASSTNIVFTATNSVWRDTGTETGGLETQRFYRTSVRVNP